MGELLRELTAEGIDDAQRESLLTTTRHDVTPAQFQAFARALRVEPAWLAVGLGSRRLVSPPPGWAAFGAHVDRPEIALEFSRAMDEDGLPLWERERDTR